MHCTSCTFQIRKCSLSTSPNTCYSQPYGSRTLLRRPSGGSYAPATTYTQVPLKYKFKCNIFQIWKVHVYWKWLLPYTYTDSHAQFCAWICISMARKLHAPSPPSAAHMLLVLLTVIYSICVSSEVLQARPLPCPARNPEWCHQQQFRDHLRAIKPGQHRDLSTSQGKVPSMTTHPTHLVDMVALKHQMPHCVHYGTWLGVVYAGLDHEHFIRENLFPRRIWQNCEIFNLRKF